MGKYYGFADFEFTCGKGIYRFDSEILSVGIVICDSSQYNIITTFYSTCKPIKNPKLTEMCVELTHLTQREIDSADNSNYVMKIVNKIMERYNIKKLYVWGDFDSVALDYDAKIHQKNRMAYASINKVKNKLFNIQKTVIKSMGLTQQISISTLSEVFGFIPPDGTFHNALNDALALHAIYRGVYTTDFRSNPKYEELLQKLAHKKEQNAMKLDQARYDYCQRIPFSKGERKTYEMMKTQDNTKGIRHFLLVRSKIMRTMEKYPDADTYFMNVLNQGNSAKSISVSVFNPRIMNNNYIRGLRTVKFTRDDFNQVVIEEMRIYLSTLG